MSSHDVWQRFKITATKYTEEGRTLAQAAAVFKVNIDTLIGWKSVMRQPEPVKRSHIDERSQQLFDSKRSTCAQWGGIPVNTAAEKSVSASIFFAI